LISSNSCIVRKVLSSSIIQVTVCKKFFLGMRLSDQWYLNFLSGRWWLSFQRESSGGERPSSLPDVVRGALITAIGSSFPELSAATLSTIIHGEFELGVAAIVGSAIFNIMVIPSLSSLFMDSPMDVNRAVVYKEAQFYIIAVATLLLTFSFAVIYFPVSGMTGVSSGKMNRLLAILPLLLYGLYVFIQYQIPTTPHPTLIQRRTGAFC